MCYKFTQYYRLKYYNQGKIFQPVIKKQASFLLENSLIFFVEKAIMRSLLYQRLP